MGTIIGFALSGICILAGLILFVLVLIRLFKKEGPLKGILGVICGIYTFIWGWLKHKELKLTRIMAIWTAVLIIPIVVQVVFASGSISLMVNAVKTGQLSGSSSVIGSKLSLASPYRPSRKNSLALS